MNTRSTIGRTIIAWTIFAVMTTVFSACRSPKNVPLAPDSEWSSVYLPVKVSLNKPTSFSLSGRATIERDRAIHVSMRFLGMEVAWMAVVNDSVYVVDKYHKYAFAEPLSTVLGKRYDKYDVADIIRILFGLQNIEKNPYVTVTTDEHLSTPAGNVARRVVIESDTKHGRFSGNVTWNFDEAQWNNPERHVPAPKISDNYRRIDLNALRKALKSFKI